MDEVAVRAGAGTVAASAGVRTGAAGRAGGSFAGANFTGANFTGTERSDAACPPFGATSIYRAFPDEGITHR